jgi:hypothetical protein
MAKQAWPTKPDLYQRARNGEIPRKRSVWKHKTTGTLYYVTGYTVREEDWTIGICYVPLNSTGLLPCDRRLSEFMDGRFEEVFNFDE